MNICPLGQTLAQPLGVFFYLYLFSRLQICKYGTLETLATILVKSSPNILVATRTIISSNFFNCTMKFFFPRVSKTYLPFTNEKDVNELFCCH